MKGAMECQHWAFISRWKFNGGNPVYVCDNCEAIVGRVALDGQS